MELVLDHTRKEPAPQQTLEMIRHAVAHGLILIRAGLYSNCVRLLPPLTISDEELDEGMAVLGRAVHHIQDQQPRKT
jgi:4-aminobutyrate aminotransferase / (S)-3-amino-2-methylpropionate transaminase / 5-aminovalerate transaminase